MSISIHISELPHHSDPVVLGPALGRVHEIFEELADQYGKLFTIQLANQPVVVVADATPINFILLKRPDLFAPYHRISGILKAIKKDGIVASDGHEWKQQREIIAAAMESGHLHQYFGYIKAVTEDLKNRWISNEENLSKSDLETEIYGFSISLFTAVMFGDMAYMSTDEKRAAESLLHNLVTIMSRRIDALLPQMHLESFSEDKDFDEKVAKAYSIIENVITHNENLLADNNGTGKVANILQALIETMKEKGLNIRNAKLIENIMEIVVTSEFNTANALFQILYYVARNPQVQTEIQNEIDAILGNYTTIENIEDLKKHKCIENVILETMRMSSGCKLIIVQAKTDLLLDHVQIPSGTPLVLLTAYCALDEENFHRAAVFDCQRWRRDSKVEFQQHNSKAFLGFGAGPRSCPGRGLAMLVMKTVLAMIFRNFQVCHVTGNSVSNKTVPEDKSLYLDFTIQRRGNNQHLHSVSLMPNQ